MSIGIIGRAHWVQLRPVAGKERHRGDDQQAWPAHSLAVLVDELGPSIRRAR